MNKLKSISIPDSEAELLDRAMNLSGMTFSQLAYQLGITIPNDINERKGWLGMAIERALGATSGSLPQPDFFNLEIELKTLPLNQSGKPSESTFITSISFSSLAKETWLNSVCYSKLKKVLWIPVEGVKDTRYSERRIGSPTLWSPGGEDLFILERDWNELTNMILQGNLNSISAHYGEYLQIRPKAANSRALCNTVDGEGHNIQTLPRGFYLRSSFTQSIISF